MQMFYRVMKGIYQFAANLLWYILTKYYWNRSTSDLVIAKSKRVNFFWNTVYNTLQEATRGLHATAELLYTIIVCKFQLLFKNCNNKSCDHE